MTLSAAWKRTIDAGFTDPARWQWPGLVNIEVSIYNVQLATSKDYISVNWKLVLAMLWVESGGPKCAAWNGRVMQIGNPGDPGFAALKKREGATALVVREELLTAIATADNKTLNTPLFNIQAGIAYLFVRMVKSEMASIPDSVDPSLHEHEVQKGESGSKIATLEGTTLDDLRASNPGVDIANLHIGQMVKFHKAHTGRQIIGWRVFEPSVIASQYNVGDPSYAEKLRYVLAGLEKE